MILLDILRWYLTGMFLTLAIITVHMQREGVITRTDIVMTLFLGGLLWPIGLIIFATFAFDNVDMDKVVWKSAENKKSTIEMNQRRSEEE